MPFTLKPRSQLKAKFDFPFMHSWFFFFFGLFTLEESILPFHLGSFLRTEYRWQSWRLGDNLNPTMSEALRGLPFTVLPELADPGSPSTRVQLPPGSPSTPRLPTFCAPSWGTSLFCWLVSSSSFLRKSRWALKSLWKLLIRKFLYFGCRIMGVQHENKPAQRWHTHVHNYPHSSSCHKPIYPTVLFYEKSQLFLKKI